MSPDDLRSLDEIADVEDPAERRRLTLRKLEHVYQMALAKSYKGEPAPDCNGAVSAMREAIPLLTIEPIKPGPAGSLLGGAFERPKSLKAVP